ncbi:Anti-lipopolysaccharide factor [Chionoecetes opilio]|uniref:Anti-lipopolysaccharide factor n=1 Tax=Chionoecetes opilio TaxID=41210 RepID=A0A8J5C6J6_CHIOP|nr:Anti-lipopolysaccharide factor [Chionoecetes opilio]
MSSVPFRHWQGKVARSGSCFYSVKFVSQYRYSMSRGCVALLVVVVVGLCLAPAPTKAGFDLSSILSSVAGDAVNRLYVDREINLMDRYCVMSRRPHFHRWELKWRSTVTCPGWTPIKGRGG